MNEAPKKIWMSTDVHAWAIEDDVFNVPYIRADLVNGLVDVMQECIHGMTGFYELNKQTLKAEAVLKAMKEDDKSYKQEFGHKYDDNKVRGKK